MSVMNNMPDFVRKREKIGYAIFFAIVAALLVSGLYAILPSAIAFFTLLETAFMKLIVLAGVTLVGSFIALNMKTAWMLLKVLSRKITNQVYSIFPDSVMEERLKDAEEKRDELRQRREEIGKVRESLKGQVP